MKLAWILVIALPICAANAVAAPPNPAALAAKIDQHLSQAWENARVEPAPIADDATFLRRIYLDLIGRIPTAAETREFLDDVRKDKRARLVMQLTDSGAHSRHFATTWRRTWAPQTDTPEFANLVEDLEAWAAVRLRDNVPYDKMVRELLTTPRVRSKEEQQSASENVTPIGFIAASQFKSETLAASTTRAFLGLNLDCAQCHDHPFSRWTRDQFWQTAAFFEAPKPSAALLQITIPGTERTLSPELLDKKPVTWPESMSADTGRKLLADWITAKQNPYFARNAVNRLWAQFFGTGLVEPLDDLSEDNPPPMPALLGLVASEFEASNFDLKYLTRALALTETYERTSVVSSPEAEDPQLFARMPIRGLSGEQLYDSLRVAGGLPTVRNDLLVRQNDRARERFAAQFGIERPIDAERSIIQSLSLMNGAFIGELTNAEKNPLLVATAESPFLNSQAQIDTLFVATLNRRPTADESSRLVNYLDSGGDERTRRQSLADIFWSLLNSSEFNTNH
jgi:hypothetical protein